ncbi:MAG: putative permease YjgP/YjgQ family protein [Deltaproteobacteria bacterium ADurb.Bin510]|nr:MAG: putative permease YjgP/YjgQ family protein [Deltaproteobacteria bacterium ADurb.Bin510]
MQIRRYVLKNVFKTFLGALAVLYAVMGIVQGIKLGGVLSLKDIDLFLLAMVPLTAFILPMALLFSILLVLEKLSSESEMIAMQACGVRKRSWAGILVVLGLACAALQMQIATDWGPRSMKTIQERLKASAPTKIFALLKERDFNDTFKNLVIYVESIDRDDEELRGVYLETKDEPATIITAEYGKLKLVDEAIVMLLLRGSVYQQSDKALRHLDFDSYLFKLEADSGQKMSIRMHQSATQPELKAMIKTWAYSSWVKEYHDRYSFPLLNLIVVMMAVTFGVQRPRTPRFTGFVTGIATLIGYYLVYVLSDRLVRGLIVSPVLGSWLPNLVFAVILVAVWLTRRYLLKDVR